MGSSKSRKTQSAHSQDVMSSKDEIDVPAVEPEVDQTEIRNIIHQELWVARSGPLPHPEEMKQYENILPGSADRLITMVEEQAQHRRQLEASLIKSNTKLEVRGQFFGFLIAMTALIGGGYIMASGQSVWGAAVAISAIAGLSGVFIWKSRERNREFNKQMKDENIPELAPPPEPPQEPKQ